MTTSKKCMKMCFGSKAQAKAAVREMRSTRFGGQGRRLRPYDCTQCEYWHLTSQTKPQSRRIQKKHGDR